MTVALRFPLLPSAKILSYLQLLMDLKIQTLMLRLLFSKLSKMSLWSSIDLASMTREFLTCCSTHLELNWFLLEFMKKKVLLFGMLIKDQLLDSVEVLGR